MGDRDKEVAAVRSVPEMPPEIKVRPAEPDELKVRFLRVSQFSRVTNMPQPTVFRFIKDGELKAYRRGRSLFIPIEEVERFIMAEVATQEVLTGTNHQDFNHEV